MGKPEVLDPAQQLRPAVDFLPEPTHANKVTRIPVHNMVPVDDRVRPNGEIPVVGGNVGTVPVEFSQVATRDDSGHAVVCWAFEGRLWVPEGETGDAAAIKWLRGCLGPRCFRVEVVGSREKEAVPVRAYFNVAA